MLRGTDGRHQGARIAGAGWVHCGGVLMCPPAAAVLPRPPVECGTRSTATVPSCHSVAIQARTGSRPAGRKTTLWQQLHASCWPRVAALAWGIGQGTRPPELSAFVELPLQQAQGHSIRASRCMLLAWHWRAAILHSTGTPANLRCRLSECWVVNGYCGPRYISRSPARSAVIAQPWQIS